MPIMGGPADELLGVEALTADDQIILGHRRVLNSLTVPHLGLAREAWKTMHGEVRDDGRYPSDQLHGLFLMQNE